MKLHTEHNILISTLGQCVILSIISLLITLYVISGLVRVQLEWFYKQLRAGVTGCRGGVPSSLKPPQLQNPELLHSFTPNSELLIEPFVQLVDDSVQI